ncbi:hypothetical protein EVAR_60896_1 [Eumeta japonica]|uniref:Uncharacterized protein n=1 Tax=Eumeta variegata TaxID=151549 RepID=A0A4C1YFX7_EUMVA|nr:hypothetical protein EVAR_60896_1 [Eumeta japonica]
MPPLLLDRLTYSKAFSHEGLDYLAVRAIHLELVKDLTAEECLLAFRRTVASKGKIAAFLKSEDGEIRVAQVKRHPLEIEHEVGIDMVDGEKRGRIMQQQREE